MADQHIPVQIERCDYRYRVGGQMSQSIAGCWRIGLAPTALVDRDRVEIRGQTLDHVAPCARRSAPIVQKDECRRTRTALFDVQLNAVGCDKHGQIP